MGNQKLKWTKEEENALLAGITKYGTGKWRNILSDPEFAPSLTLRSNIDLKDKWRNLNANSMEQISKRNSRFAKLKALSAPLSSTTNPDPAASVSKDVSSNTFADSSPNSMLDTNSAPRCRYNSMIYEALSSIKDTKGSDISAILHFIEDHHEVPQNFRKLLSSRLRRLVSKAKLEKVDNLYKVRNETSSGTRKPTPNVNDMGTWQLQKSMKVPCETMEEAASNAARIIVEAENKSIIASDAIKEAERVAKMAENAESMLELVKELFQECKF